MAQALLTDLELSCKVGDGDCRALVYTLGIAHCPIGDVDLCAREVLKLNEREARPKKKIALQLPAEPAFVSSTLACAAPHLFLIPLEGMLHRTSLQTRPRLPAASRVLFPPLDPYVSSLIWRR